MYAERKADVGEYLLEVLLAPVFKVGGSLTTYRVAGNHAQPPPLLTEPELIAAMDEQGIGTDATIATHIETILKREYVVRLAPVLGP